jgi:hypothetical protein
VTPVQWQLGVGGHLHAALLSIGNPAPFTLRKASLHRDQAARWRHFRVDLPCGKLTPMQILPEVIGIFLTNNHTPMAALATIKQYFQLAMNVSYGMCRLLPHRWVTLKRDQPCKKEK